MSLFLTLRFMQTMPSFVLAPLAVVSGKAH